MKIYLVGYMYSGKSTLGRRLAMRLGCQFLDLDNLFEERYHTTIPLFFSRYDEAAFRQLEQQLLHTTAELDNVVISTGGGTPCYQDNMQWINAHGTSIFLEVSLPCLLARSNASRKQRPILTRMTPEEREAYIQQHLSTRLPVYRQAHIIFPADNPDVDSLVGLL